ncbi:MAG: tetratricopeptide repeat protein [Verrucomicrobia bacterium]|nr:tetratricopeptide repeat protein [Cytophagales bacterium]
MTNRFLLLIYIFLSSIPAFTQTTAVFTHEDLTYRTGLELYQKQHYVAASQQFETYLKLGKNDLQSLDCQYFMALCALYLENENAENRVENFIAANPTYPRNTEAYFLLGTHFFDQKNYPKALRYLTEIDTESLSSDQYNEARYKLGYALFSEKRFKEALEIFNSLKKSQHFYTADANYYAGFLEYQNQQYDQAVADLQKSSSGNQYKNRVPYLITGVYYKQKKYDELITYGEKALQDKNTQNPNEIRLLLADAYFNKENYKKANQYFNSYLAANRNKMASDFQLKSGISSYKSGDYQQAMQLLQTINSKDSLGQVAAYYLGLAYLKTDNKPFALRAFDEARKTKNRNLQQEALFLYGKVAYEQSDFSESINSLKTFNRTFPDSKYENEANEIISDAYLDSDDYTQAIAYIESIKRKTPRINAAYQRVTYNRGVALFNQDKFAESIAQFQKSLQTPVNEQVAVAAMYWTAEAHSVLKNYAEAIKNYTFVQKTTDAKSTPYFVKSKYGLGYAYFNTKDYTRAAINFREYAAAMKLTDDKENYADALLRLADCEYVGKNYSEALKNYTLASESAVAARDYAVFQKGVLLGLLKRNAEAKNTFDEVVKKFPDSPFVDDALFQKANLDFEQGNYKTAIESFSRLVTEKSASDFVPTALLKRAAAYGNTQQYDAAVADYKKILEEYPQHPAADDAISGIREALANANRSDEMTDILLAYKNANPKGGKNTESIEFETAKDLYVSEKYQKAVMNFEKFVQDYPASANLSDAQYFLGDAYLRIEDKKNAVRYFEQVVAAGKGNNAPKAAIKAAEIRMTEKNYGAAVANYRFLLGASRSKKDQLTAYTGLLDAYFDLEKSDSTLYFADLVVQNAGANPRLVHKAELKKGKVYFRNKDFTNAGKIFKTLVKDAKDEFGAEAQFLTGDLLFQQKNYKQSLEALFAVNENFSDFAVWRNKAFLLIAENYIAQQEIFQAKATLQSIMDNSEDKETIAAAKKRLEELEGK